MTRPLFTVCHGRTIRSAIGVLHSGPADPQYHRRSVPWTLNTSPPVIEKGTHPARPARRASGASKPDLLTANDVSALLSRIDTSTPDGLHDRAMIGVLLHCFVRPGAMLRLRVRDYVRESNRRWLRLPDSGGLERRISVRSPADAWLDAYLKSAAIGSDAKASLFWPVLGQDGGRERPPTRSDVLRALRSLAKKAGVSKPILQHTLFASGIAMFLETGGDVEEVKSLAGFRTSDFLRRLGIRKF